MLLCLYRHPVVTPDVARMGVAQEDTVIDVHLACMMSMLDHMKPRRAAEIATALAPPDLLTFLEGGRHSWNALHDSLDRLGDALQIGLETTDEEQVVLSKGDVRLVPIVPPGTGWSSETVGQWASMPVGAPGSSAVVALHTNGRAHLPEYLAVIGTTANSIAVSDAMAAVALVAIARPSRPESACLLHPVGHLPADETDIVEIISSAVSQASEHRTLYTGDVVRCGPALVDTNFDLRESRRLRRAAAEDILPTR